MILVSFCALPGGLVELETNTWLINKDKRRDIRGLDYHAGTNRVYFSSSNHGSPDVGYVELNNGHMKAVPFEGQDWHGLTVIDNDIYAMGPLAPSRMSRFDLELLSREEIHIHIKDVRFNDFWHDDFKDRWFACDHGGGIYELAWPKPKLLYHSTGDTHSVVQAPDGRIYWCESAQHRVKCDGKIVFEDLEDEGYVRGLAIDGGCLYVGMGRHRHRPGAGSKVVKLGREDLSRDGAMLEVLDEWTFDYKEIYGIRSVPGVNL